MTTIRLLIADDHRFFRDGVRAVLQAVEGFDVVGEAGNGADAIEQAAALQPDVILMDLKMPGLNGIDATRSILRASPHTGVIVVTMFEDTDSVLAAMRAGARGYILKDTDEEELIRSIRAVANGEALFGPAVARRLLNYITDVTPRASSAAFPELTDREREVLKLMVEGLNNQEIADRLVVSLSTVKYLISNILSKLRVDNRVAAVTLAIQKKLV
jgi:DNA-binding NarL/FixJ family response regulator